MSNYEQYIESTNSYPYGFINILDAKSGKKLSLKNVEQNNYSEIIRYFLKDYFGFEQVHSIKMKTSNGIKDISNLKFNDLIDSVGTVIYLAQYPVQY